MSSKGNSLSRRGFFSDLAKDVVRVILEAKKDYDGAQSIADTFSSFETSAPIALAYPREIFEDEARRLGIDIDEVGLEEAVRQIVEHSASSR